MERCDGRGRNLEQPRANGESEHVRVDARAHHVRVTNAFQFDQRGVPNTRASS